MSSLPHNTCLLSVWGTMASDQYRDVKFLGQCLVMSSITLRGELSNGMPLYMRGSVPSHTAEEKRKKSGLWDVSHCVHVAFFSVVIL